MCENKKDKKLNNVELFGRRTFFRRSVKTVLPILSAVALGSLTSLADSIPAGNCANNCASYCIDHCRDTCKYLCHKDGCTNGCHSSCGKNCGGSCHHHADLL